MGRCGKIHWEVRYMKSKLFLGAILTVFLVGGNIFAAGKPKVTMEQARAIALKRIPGTVQSFAIHKKVSSFEILAADGIKTNVIVSGKGKIKLLADR